MKAQPDSRGATEIAERRRGPRTPVEGLSLSLGLVLGIMVVVLVTATRGALTPYLGDRLPFELYLPALAALGWWLGIRVYIVSSVLAMVLMAYFFLHPQWEFAALARHDVVRIVLDLIVVAALGLVLGKARHYQHRAGVMAERALIESRQRETVQRELASFIAQVRHQAIFTLDTDGIITSWNPGVHDVLGYERDEFIGMDGRRLFLEADVAAGVAAVELRTAEETGSASNDRWMRRKDGSAFFAAGSTSAVRDSAGRLVGYTKVMRDLTELRGALEAREQSEARFRGIIDSAMDAILTVDEEQRITVFNPAAEKMFRCRASEAIGTSLDRFIPPVMRDEHRAHIERFGATGTTRRSMGAHQPGGSPLTAVRADGEVFPMEATISQIAVGGRRLYTAIVRDISERMRHEAALARHAAELERSNADLQDFAYVVSHDLKEPLRGISNYAAFVLEDHGNDVGSEGREKLETIRRLARRSYDLLDAILDFSRIGREGLNVEEVPAPVLFGRAIETMRARIEEEGAEVTVEDGRGCAEACVRCDPDLAVQALTNLMSNGLKYNQSEPKRIELGCEALGDGRVALYVRDNGIGIEPRYQETIFKMFKRLHARDRFGGGTGAGLTIVKRIVERHGGRIWLESEPGTGTTFWLTLGTDGFAVCTGDGSAEARSHGASGDGPAP